MAFRNLEPDPCGRVERVGKVLVQLVGVRCDVFFNIGCHHTKICFISHLDLVGAEAEVEHPGHIVHLLELLQRLEFSVPGSGCHIIIHQAKTLGLIPDGPVIRVDGDDHGVFHGDDHTFVRLNLIGVLRKIGALHEERRDAAPG